MKSRGSTSANGASSVWLLTCVGAVLSLFSSELVAQKTTFDPSLFFSYFRAENLDLTGASNETDFGFRVGIELPVERELRRGTLAFSYRPRYEEFQDSEELNNVSHILQLNLGLQPTGGSEFSLGLGYAKTIEQGDGTSSEDADLFLNQRTDRVLTSVKLDYRNRFRSRWGWRGSVGYSVAKFENIEGFGDAGPVQELEDRTSTRGLFGLIREVSRRTSIEGTYEYRVFDLDTSGQETAQLASFGVSRELSPRSAVGFAVGVFRSTGVAARGGRGDLDEAREGVQGRMVYNYSLKRVAMDFLARVEPTSGGARQGTSTNGLVQFSLRSQDSRAFSWRGSIRYARRVASDPDLATVESVAVSLTTETRLARVVGLRLGARYIDQTGEGEEFDLFSQGGLSLVWYPLAGSRITGRKSQASP